MSEGQHQVEGRVGIGKLIAKPLIELDQDLGAQRFAFG